MKLLSKAEAFPIGLAMFSMFFGAGNIIFPLAVGQFAGDKNLFAILGLILTAALIPAAGVFAMILYEGDTRKFFGRLGSWPGFLLALITISLLGPLGSTPRCIALSYSTLKNVIPTLSPALFSAGACSLIFLFTIKKQRILTWLGWVLTPVLLTSLAGIIALGLIAPPDAQTVQASGFEMFFHGLKEGYNTMDLLAAFFFSSAILNILRLKSTDRFLSITTKACFVGTSLLAIVYICFSYLASFHAHHLTFAASDELLAAIAYNIAGPYGGLLACLAIAMACLTTAIALISAFADFIQKEVFQDSVSYSWIILGSLLITFFISTFEFTGISSFLGPVLQICYPGLIVLTILNILNRMTHFTPVRIPVFATFAISTVNYFWM